MKQYFDYLDALRESGVTNMYGAVPYLQQDSRSWASTTLRPSMSCGSGSTATGRKAGIRDA